MPAVARRRHPTRAAGGWGDSPLPTAERAVGICISAEPDKNMSRPIADFSLEYNAGRHVNPFTLISSLNVHDSPVTT